MRVVTETRNTIDFAQILKYTSDVLYPRAEKIVLVTDNLNIHAVASLYKAFRREEARRLAERFEWHYTPKHGSWLGMAEIEGGIMSRQAFARPLPDLESFKEKIRVWTIKRNAECKKNRLAVYDSGCKNKISQIISNSTLETVKIEH